MTSIEIARAALSIPVGAIGALAVIDILNPVRRPIGVWLAINAAILVAVSAAI